MKLKKNERLRLNVASLILERNGEVLMLKKAENRGGEYGLVGGRIEAGESAKQALLRETFEEAGITLDPKDVTLVLTIHRLRMDTPTVHFFFFADRWEGHIHNKEPHKCEHLRWAPFTQLPNNTATVIKRGIEAFVKGETYLELGFKNKHRSPKIPRQLQSKRQQTSNKGK